MIIRVQKEGIKVDDIFSRFPKESTKNQERRKAFI